MNDSATVFQHRFGSVEEYLHHRPPYLMVDRIVSIAESEIQTELNAREISGHFPGAPIFPGAMMQEFMTQSAGILIAAEHNPMRDYRTEDPHFNPYALGVLVRVRDARYRSFARPRDLLRATVRLVEHLGHRFEFAGEIVRDSEQIMRIRFQLANIESRLLNGDPDANSEA